MLDFAIIGFGRMGQIHYRALKRSHGVRIQAVCDPTCDEPLPEPVCKTHEEMLRRFSFDAVIIASPNALHASIASDMIMRNKHTLIEKPVALTFAEAEALLNLSRKYDVQACTSFTERFNPVIQELRRCIRFRQIKSIKTFRSGLYPEKTKYHNVLLDLGVHDIDLVRYLFGREIIMNNTIISISSERPSNEKAVINVNISDDTDAVIHVQWHPTLRQRTIEVSVEDDIFLGDLLNQSLTVISGQSHQWIKKIPVIRNEDPALAQLKSFIHLIQTGQNSGTATLEDGMKTLEVIDSCIMISP